YSKEKNKCYRIDTCRMTLTRFIIFLNHCCIFGTYNENPSKKLHFYSGKTNLFSPKLEASTYHSRFPAYSTPISCILLMTKICCPAFQYMRGTRCEIIQTIS